MNVIVGCICQLADTQFPTTTVGPVTSLQRRSSSASSHVTRPSSCGINNAAICRLVGHETEAVGRFSGFCEVANMYSPM